MYHVNAAAVPSSDVHPKQEHNLSDVILKPEKAFSATVNDGLLGVDARDDSTSQTGIVEAGSKGYGATE